MHCLIVVSHSLQTSLSHRFAALASEMLTAAGHDVTTLDLYAENFDPRLTTQERESYYAKAYRPEASLAPHIDALQTAEMLVLAFPTWWFGPPAMLKGWIDRVFSPGIAFDHGANFGPIGPKLTALRQVAAITTLGTPWWVDWLAMRRPVRRMVKTAICGACAPNATVRYLPFYAAENPGEARILAFEQRIRQALLRQA